jgi:HD-GYP domain-containing protein (c-di-GMP phosphodiesterase class II)
MPVDTATAVDQYFSIPLDHLAPQTVVSFDLYLRHGSGEPVLYRAANMEFGQEHQLRLAESGVVELFVHRGQAEAYREYRREAGGEAEPGPTADESELVEILQDSGTPLARRCQTLLGVSHEVIEVALADLGSPGLPDRVRRVSEATVRFLAAEPEAFRSLVRLVSTNAQLRAHLANTSLYAIELGRLADYGDMDQLARLGRAALVHDVGKVDLPETLLRREGSLNDLEYAEMMSHTELGLSRLVEAGWTDELCLEVCTQHHERCDCSGWPRGLAGEQLSLAVRIVGIADTFDTLTTGQGPGRGLTGYQALWKMKRERPGQYDPHLLDHFVRGLLDSQRR